MSYSVDWIAKVITIPRSDLLLMSAGIYQLDLGEFHQEIRRLEWDFDDGLNWERIIDYNLPVSVGGILLAAVINIINGYKIEFENGSYAVNLAGANSNLAENSVVNNVSIRPQNSAGLINLDTLLSAAYQGRVVVDPIMGVSGTQTPIGTFSTPSGNMPDAIEIARNNGLREFYVMRNLTLTEDYSDGYEFIGGSPLFLLTIEAQADVTSLIVRNIGLTGHLDGLNVLRDCGLVGVLGASGSIDQCALYSTMEIIGNTLVTESYSNISGSGYPVITVTAGNLKVRDFHGSLGLAGITQGVHSIGIDGGGRCVIEASCTGGEIHVRGAPYDVVDNSGAGCTVFIELNSKITNDISEVLGIRPGSPVTLGNGKYLSDNLDVAVTDNGDGTYTLERQA